MAKAKPIGNLVTKIASNPVVQKVATKAAGLTASQILKPTVLLDDMISPDEANSFDDEKAIKGYKKR